MIDPQAAVNRKLRSWQTQLLDLSRANRLLYYKPTRASTVPIVLPEPADLFQQLVVRGRKLTFPLADETTLFDLDQEANVTQSVNVEPAATMPGESTATEAKSPAGVETESLPPLSADRPAGEIVTSATASSPVEPQPATSPARKPAANEIGTSLTEQQSSRALYNLRSRARSALEEQGVNVLFVALGMLHWIDPATNESIRSPLLLVPVALNREALRKPYTLSMLEDDLVLNPTLAHKLETDFALKLPDIPDDIEEVGLAAYLDRIRAAIQIRSGWELTVEATLSTFSFQKINLYQDLETNRDFFSAHPLIAALSGGGSLPQPPEFITAAELDDHIPPITVFQIVDADSSQQEAIEAAKRGASFVLQGPPGTGKSQTITNIIAECLAAGKRVLFVSQKMAALEVVQRRLNAAGLGDFCLQLHSHKRDKREVVGELVQTLSSPEVQLKSDYQAGLVELAAARQTLNAYVRALHLPRFALHQTAFQAHGEMARLQGAPELRFEVGDVISVSAHELAQRVNLLERFAGLPEVIDRYATHPWRGSALRSVSFTQRDRLAQALDELIGLLPHYTARMELLAAACGLCAPGNLQEASPLLSLLQEYQPRIFALDLGGLKQRFAETYRPFFRFLIPSYRTDMQLLGESRLDQARLSYEQALAAIDRARAIKQTLAGEAAIAEPMADPIAYARDTAALASQIDQALKVLAEVFGGQLPAIEGQPFTQAPLSTLPDGLSVRRENLAALEDYAGFLRLTDEAPGRNLSAFGSAALAAHLPAAQWRDTYLYAFYKSFVDAATSADEALRAFDSRAHTTLIDRFRELDQQQLILARARIRALLGERRPKNSWVDAASAEQTILRREAAKKRRLKPLRRLFGEIPHLLTELKPCLLMSPITVSTLLDPNVFRFDLVIFDEASQITPEEAAGAIVRGDQTIIVGDQQQLPPTRFFETVGGEEDDEAGDDYVGLVFESILEEAQGLSVPQKMLLWHYRSRDESLIAFSNHYFYHDRLYTFPNVQHAGNELGLQFIYVPGGVYRRGQSLRRNEVEARRVVDLIFEHFTLTPGRTLGVIAFSISQRDAIRLEWERQRREQPDFERFFDEDAPEPFFIKNLEMVQGDERDVIIFSVGYGRDEDGKLTHNFGPLNQAGGERRLNVAISRARYHVKLVSSIVPEDIDLTRTTSQGARMLKQYMTIARDGLKLLDGDGSLSFDVKQESPFEDVVYRALVAKGLAVDRRVGVSGYRIDLAVVDPKTPGHYLLGIECDGATYRSAQTARDRDRLRRQVLEGLGWRLQRVWSRDWLNNREREMDKILTALIEASKPHQQPSMPATVPDSPTKAATADAFLSPTSVAESAPAWPKDVRPYRRAVLRQQVGGRDELGRANPRELADDVVQVVNVEGPVHIDDVFDRIGDAWGVTRIGSRIHDNLSQAVSIAIRSNRIRRVEDFLWPIEMAQPIVRVPGQGDAPRPIEMIAPEEIAEAAYLCVVEARSLSQADLIRETAQLLGYGRASAKIEAVVSQAIMQLQAAKRIEIDADTVRPWAPG